MTVTGRLRRSDGAFGLPEPSQTTVSLGPGRYSEEIVVAPRYPTRTGRRGVMPEPSTEPAEPPAGGSPRPAGIAVRAYTRPCRRRRVEFRYSDDEYAAVAAAAARAGYTTSGFIAETALAAAGERDELPPTLGLQRELVVALNLAREQVARIGTNLNQAVARLNATGEAPPWLDRAVALSARVVARLEDTAAEISAGLPGGHRRRRWRRAA